MPILNYRTEIPPERTIVEITAMLVRKGARSIQQEFREDGSVKSVVFVMVVGGVPTRFELPANIDGVAGVLLKEEPWSKNRNCGPTEYTLKLRRRAEWVAWRILKDWALAQMALIESGQAEPAQVFLPYMVNDEGQTLFQRFVENNQKQLGDGFSK